MRVTTIAGWGALLWVVAGLQAALGLGWPGPLFVVGVAAGLRGGPWAGACAGGVAGLCAIVLGTGHSLSPLVTGVLSGILAGWAGSRLSRSHVFVAAVLAGVLSLGIALAMALPATASFASALRVAGLAAGHTVLWMIPIYGIVLIVLRIPMRSALRS